MIVVVEGIDNSGKSTLVKRIAEVLGWPIQSSEGPPKYPGEMNDRLKRYQFLDRTVFDRHPVVSQSIYRNIRTGLDPGGMRPDYVEQFYNGRPLFIYCDPIGRGMKGHVFNEGVDTEEHLRQVDEAYNVLLNQYRDWAIKYAQHLYRIGDNMDDLANVIFYRVNGRSKS